MWPFRHPKTPDTPDASPAIQAAERRTEQLEARADRAAESLRDRLRRNNFAEGIAMAWDQTPRHRQGSA